MFKVIRLFTSNPVDAVRRFITKGVVKKDISEPFMLLESAVFSYFVNRDSTLFRAMMYYSKKSDEFDPRTTPVYCGLVGAQGTGKSRALIEIVKGLNEELGITNRGKDFVLVPLIVTYNSGMEIHDTELEHIEFYSALRVILS